MSVVNLGAAPVGGGTVGDLLRGWRQRRRRSQLDLASEAAVSARHLSFVETGRSKPSRELVLHLAEHLDVPVRERNALLLAAGYAPAYRETALDDAAMAPVSDALRLILAGHEPFPAVVVDRRWDLVSANDPAVAILSDGVDPALLGPEANTLRISLHPDGLAPRIANFAEYSAHLMLRLRRQADLSADPEVAALYDELRHYPGVLEASTAPVTVADLLYVPLRLRLPDGGELTFFSTLTTFGTAVDITLAELSIEAFFPADAHTGAVLSGDPQRGVASRLLAGAPDGGPDDRVAVPTTVLSGDPLRGVASRLLAGAPDGGPDDRVAVPTTVVRGDPL